RWGRSPRRTYQRHRVGPVGARPDPGDPGRRRPRRAQGGGMSLIVVNAGETAVLEADVAQPMPLRLFTKRVTEGRTPDQIDALDASDFDEAAWPGYQPAALNPAGWTIEVGSPTAAVHAPRTFARLTSGDPETVWGYYVTRSDGRLLWFEELPGPIVVEDAGDEVTVEATLTLDDTEGHGMLTGMVMPYAGETLPPGFLWCNGAAVSRTTYARLFAVIGTRFGPGDGSTTFNVPDLRGLFPLGRAQSGTGSVLGETGGSLDHVHGLDSRN